MPSSRASSWKAVERLAVGRIRVLGAPGLLQPRVLGTDRRVVEAGRDRVRQLDVAVRILQHEGARALQHAGGAAGESRRMTAWADRFAAGLDADQADVGIVDERIEDADGVAAAADAGDRRRPAARRSARESAGALPGRSPTETRAPSADTDAGRARSPAGSAYPTGRATQSRIASLIASFKRAGARLDALDRRAEQPHAEHVERLPRACPRCPCRRRTRDRAARRPSRWPRRAGRRRSPRRCASCPCAWRAAPGRARC